MTAINRYAHGRLVTERRIWREMVLAALDQLALAQQQLQRQQRQMADLREELDCRMGVPTDAELRRLSEE